MSYALYFNKRVLKSYNFFDRVILKMNGSKEAENMLYAVCFSDNRTDPSRQMGFFADIPAIKAVNKEWNERFPILRVKLHVESIKKSGYKAEKGTTENFALLTTYYPDFYKSCDALWLLPLLVHRVLGTGEEFLPSYKRNVEESSPLEAAFDAGTKYTLHNIVNENVVDLYKAFDNLSDPGFVAQVKKVLDPEGSYIRQTEVFSIISKEMKKNER